MNVTESIFDRLAADYDKFVSPCRACQFLVLAHEMNFRGSEKVLDLGSGPGLLSTQIAGQLHEGEVWGVDISESMVEMANQRKRNLGPTNLRFIRGDALGLNLPDKAFDAVVSSYLFHWVPDLGRCLTEIRRVLKDDGRLGIIVPTSARYGELTEAYRRVINRHCDQVGDRQTNGMIGLRAMGRGQPVTALRSAGFEVERDFELNFRERLSAASFLDRISAITWGRYLEVVPVTEREGVRAEFLREIERDSSRGPLTTECSAFVIARKRRGDEQ